MTKRRGAAFVPRKNVDRRTQTAVVINVNFIRLLSIQVFQQRFSFFGPHHYLIEQIDTGIQLDTIDQGQPYIMF